jgi:hypothetical protein
MSDSGKLPLARHSVALATARLALLLMLVAAPPAYGVTLLSNTYEVGLACVFNPQLVFSDVGSLPVEFDETCGAPGAGAAAFAEAWVAPQPNYFDVAVGSGLSAVGVGARFVLDTRSRYFYTSSDLGVSNLQLGSRTIYLQGELVGYVAPGATVSAVVQGEGGAPAYRQAVEFRTGYMTQAGDFALPFYEEAVVRVPTNDGAGACCGWSNFEAHLRIVFEIVAGASTAPSYVFLNGLGPIVPEPPPAALIALAMVALATRRADARR